MANKVVYLDDTYPDLTGTITFSGTNQPTVTGATGTITISDKITGRVQVNAGALTLVVDNAATNRTIEWTYDTQSADFDLAGVYTAVVEITFASGEVGQFPVTTSLEVKPGHKGP